MGSYLPQCLASAFLSSHLPAGPHVSMWSPSLRPQLNPLSCLAVMKVHEGWPSADRSRVAREPPSVLEASFFARTCYSCPHPYPVDAECPSSPGKRSPTTHMQGHPLVVPLTNA